MDTLPEFLALILFTPYKENIGIVLWEMIV